MIISEEKQFVHMDAKATFGQGMQTRTSGKVKWIVVCNVAAYIMRYKHVCVRGHVGMKRNF